MAEEISQPDLLGLATELTIAWLANPNTRASADEVPAFLQTMHGAVQGLVASPVPAEEKAMPEKEYTPAVSVRRSLASKDHLISMIDGKPYKTLKKHLAVHGLTPADYRSRYGLKADYPMVSENYAAMRRDLAKKIGLGRKPGAKVAAAVKSTSKPAVVKPAGAKLTAARRGAKAAEQAPAN